MLFLNDPARWIKEIFLNAGLSYGLASFLSKVALVLFVMLLSWLSFLIARVIILMILARIVKRTTSTWDDILSLTRTEFSKPLINN